MCAPVPEVECWNLLSKGSCGVSRTPALVVIVVSGGRGTGGGKVEVVLAVFLRCWTSGGDSNVCSTSFLFQNLESVLTFR